jgi:hypothetical protein
MQSERNEEPAIKIERRKYLRRHVLWQAKLQCGSYDFDCWVYKMSLGGADIRFDLPLAKGYGVVLVIKDIGAISGSTAWSGSGLLGIDFITKEDKIRRLLGNDADHFGQTAPDSE